MAVSRLFVRNLPPTITEDDFRAHFSKRFPNITDLKLFPKRRIGYVGLKSPEDATAAVKYFNKSFIRMSRIHVELAKEPELLQAAPTARKAPQGVIQESAPLKRKHEDEPSSQAEKKNKTEPESTSAQDDQQAQAKREDEAQEGQAPASDMDWMRSKTSRLLDLENDDEEEARHSTKAPQQSRELSEEEAEVNEEEQPSQQPTPPREASEDPETHALSVREGHEQTIRETGRLFLRNLPYGAQEEDLRELFASFGSLQEVHVPQDPKTGQAKGFAFALFDDHDEAVAAFKDFDGKSFQGRLMHIIPSAAKRDGKLDDFAISQLPLKKQKQIQRKGQAASSAFNWNSLYMNADAVVTSIADRLGLPKSEIIDPTSSDAAVKQAQAETHVIQETKSYFEQNGVDLNAFQRRERGDTAILVKNFPYGTKQEELQSLFEEFGDVSRVLMPPSGVIAIVEFSQRTQARAAFASLAYRKFKESMLFLEKAPRDLFNTNFKPMATSPTTDGVNAQAPKPAASELMTADEDIDSSTLYVRNLNFATTNQKFEETFKPLDGFLSARIKTKIDPKKPGVVLSMGFGFLEFRSVAQAKAAMVAMNGFSLDGHQLAIRASHKGHDAAEERRKEDREKEKRARRSKIIIKNLPFEASQKDVKALFTSYGKLRSVRVPKKFDGSRKGFAFAEFTTPKEAENAMDALRNTHFLGRRLVLDYAAGEAEDAEEEIAEMQKKVGRQTNSVALQKLTKGSERRKFTLGDADDALDA